MRLISSFLIFLILSPVVLADDRTSDVSAILLHVNSHESVLDFVSDMGIPCLKVSAGKEVYAFEMNQTISLTGKDCKLGIKMSEERFNSIIDAELAGNHKEAARLALPSVPFGLKLKIFFKCFASKDCRNYLTTYL
jgi:hypothetical protein